MATETMNTVLPVGTGDPEFEKELRKAYHHRGDYSNGHRADRGNGNSIHEGSGRGNGSWENGGDRGNGRNHGHGGGRGDRGESGETQSGTTGYINDMYDASLESQKQQLQSNYETNVSALDAEKEKAAREHDDDLARTYVEAYKKAKNFNEVQNAYGLTSGAMGQAALAQGNQLQANMTELRAVQEQVDAEIERQRSILAKEYAAAIAKAQADNDFQRAQALYEQAQKEEERMLQMKMAAGELMASVGDYSILQELYGLSHSQVAALEDYYFPEETTGTGGPGVATKPKDETSSIVDKFNDLPQVVVANTTPQDDIWYRHS